MDIVKTIKDIILITPWIISLICVTSVILPVFLFLLLWSNLILIIERLIGVKL